MTTMPRSVDIVIEQPAQEPRNGFHLIPTVELARLLLEACYQEDNQNQNPLRIGII